jgi:UDP-glucose 4-epimerase
LTKVAVIGGSGFLGRQLCNSLLKAGYEVVSCSRTDPSLPGVEFMYFDLMSGTKPPSGTSTVINCAGQISKPIITSLNLNTVGMANLARLCNESDVQLIHISSILVYGTAEHIDESSPLNPETSYSTSKAAAEILLNHLLVRQPKILRLSNLYGHGQTVGLLNYLKNAILSGDYKLEFNTDNSMVRYFLHVKDAADLIASSLNKLIASEDVFQVNIPGPDRLLLLEIISLFESEFNVKFNVKWSSQPPYDNIKNINSELCRNFFKHQFKHSLADYISEMIKS